MQFVKICLLYVFYYLNLIILGNGFSINFPGKVSGSTCYTYDNLKGTCKRLNKCRHVTYGRVKAKICGYDRWEPVVCCPQRTALIVRGSSGVSAPVLDFRCGNMSYGLLSQEYLNTEYSRDRRSVHPVGSEADISPVTISRTPVDHAHTLEVPSIFSLYKAHLSPDVYPWMALLGRTIANSPKFFCSAVLINTKWLLTAAHCFAKFYPDFVRLGEFDIDSTLDGPHTDYKMKKVIFHPKYKKAPNPSSDYHDLALIEVEGGVNLSEREWPACLPWGTASKKHISNSSSILHIRGWGATSFGGEIHTILQEAKINPFPSSKCNRSYSALPFAPTRWPQGISSHNYICAGKIDTNADTCQGDSGGPMTWYDENERYSSVVVGIVSQGYGCGLENYPGLYVNIVNEEYLEWIKDTAF